MGCQTTAALVADLDIAAFADSDCQNYSAVAVSGLTNFDSLRFDTHLFAGMAASFEFAAVPVELGKALAAVADLAMAFAEQNLCL